MDRSIARIAKTRVRCMRSAFAIAPLRTNEETPSGWGVNEKGEVDTNPFEITNAYFCKIPVLYRSF